MAEAVASVVADVAAVADVPAEPAVDERHDDRRLCLRRHPQRLGRRRLHRSSPPSRTTTRPAGPTSPRASTRGARRNREGAMSGMEIERRLPEDFFAAALRDDVLKGLTAEPKWLPPKWFYDARGSELFEEITLLPEYYPTRAEREILTDRAAEIASVTRAETLAELGSGSVDEDDTAARRPARRRHAAPLRPDRRQRGGPAGLRRATAAALPGPDDPRGRHRLRGAPGDPGLGGPAAGGVPRRHDRQPPSRGALGVPGPTPRRRCGPASGFSSARTW